MATQINLFNPALLPRKTPLPASLLPWVLAAGVVACLLAAELTTLQTSAAQAQAQKTLADIAPLQAESSRLQAQIDGRKPDAQLQAEVQQLERKLQLRQQALALLQSEGQSADDGFSPRLSALAHQTTQGVWLTRIELSAGQLTLQGRATSAERLPQWMGALRREPSFAGTAFEVFDLDQPAAEAPTDPSVKAAVVTSYQFTLKNQREPAHAADEGQKP